MDSGLVIPPLLLALLGIPLWLRRVPPNPIYGVRIPNTTDDPAVWYDVNAFAGKYLTVVGVLVTALTVGLRSSDLDPDLAVALSIGALLSGILLTIVRSFARAEAGPPRDPRRRDKS